MRMQQLPTAGADVLTYRAGQFGATFLAALAALGGLGLLQVAATVARNAAMPIALLGLIGVGFTLGGTIAVAYSLRRSGIILDRGTGRVTTWRSVLVRRSSTTRELGEFWTVLLSMGRVQRRYTSRTVYLVGLHGEVGEPFLLHWHADYATARRLAEEVSAFLSFPLTDASGTGIHSAATLPRAGAGVPRPTALECRVAWQGPTLVIEDRPVRWAQRLGLPLALFLILAPACIGLGAYAHFFDTNSPVFLDPLIAAAIVVGMLFVILCAIILSSLPQLAQRRVVEATAAGLHFRADGPFASRDRTMRRDDLCELRIALGHLSAVTPRDYRVICGTLDHPLPRGAGVAARPAHRRAPRLDGEGVIGGRHAHNPPLSPCRSRRICLTSSASVARRSSSSCRRLRAP